METTTPDQAKLLADFQALGINPGSTLFVHSSFRSLGPLAGGAEVVVAALEQAVSPDGLLLMPSFNLGQPEAGGDSITYRASRWDHQQTPSTVGYLTEFFRTMPGTYRSDHYSHSVAARGRGAREIVGGHRRDEGLESPWDLRPWGKTYGRYSPMIRAYEADGSVLMLGTDHHTCTYCHVVEARLWQYLRRAKPEFPFVGVDREAVGEAWDQTEFVRTGRVARAQCRLFPIRSYVDTVLHWVITEPLRWVRGSAAHHFQ